MTSSFYLPVGLNFTMKHFTKSSHLLGSYNKEGNLAFTNFQVLVTKWLLNLDMLTHQ